MNVFDITITSVNEATHDDYNNVLVLRVGDHSVRIEGRALDAVTEALPGGKADLTDAQSSAGDLRYALEQAQSEIQSAIESAQGSLADVESALETALGATDCHGDVASHLDDLDRALEDANDN